MYVAYITYDRRGELWKSFHPAGGLYEKGDQVRKDGNDTAWSWTHVHSHDVQTNRMSRFVQAEEVRGGFRSGYNMEGCLLYTSDAADERSSVDLGGRRIIKKKTQE